jgi:asparagine synthase (glutamine-hydrolysing)
MCGISGIVAPIHSSFNPNTLAQMTKLINHRGPDDEGFLLYGGKGQIEIASGDDTANHNNETAIPYFPKKHINNITGDFQLGFGHRRLSILDLSIAGHMPMCNAESSLWITYNGEVYNFTEIREELKSLGHIFKTETDTEVILNAYNHWGIDCLNHFVGMFAFALLDTKQHKLFLVRDRYGIKPFYYWVNINGHLFFGSEIKQFTVAEGWQPKLNKKQVFSFLYEGITDHSGETLIHGVFSIPPGHFLEINLNQYAFNFNQQLDTKAWYNPVINPFKGTFEEAVVQFKQLFAQSVKLHLRSDVEVGCTLSGGFDSSSITCVVNDLLKREGKIEKHNTFSAIDGDSKYSEKKWIEIVNNNLNVKAHYLTPDPDKIIHNLEHYLWMMDEPTGSMSPYLGYLVDSMAANAGIKVLLNGQGSDEYLSCYGELKRLRRMQALDSLNIFRIKKEYSCSFFKAARMGIRALGRKMYILLFGYEKYRKKFANLIAARPWLTHIDNDKLNQSDIQSFHQKEDFNSKSYKSISAYQLFKWPLPMYLRWSDRNSMASSIEARVPFLDHRLVEFCHSLPLEFIDDETKTKKVLLTAMQGIVPDEILNRKDKMGYVAPEERWLKEEYVNEFKTLLANSIIYSKGIIHPSIMSYYQEMIDNKTPFNFSIWRFIVFGYWMKKFEIDFI